MLRTGSAVSAALTAAVLVGCGSEVSSPDSVPAPAATESTAPTPTEWRGDARGPVREDPNRRLLRCLHATTVPVEGEPSPSVPDPSPEIEPHFWFPLYLECPPAVGLLEEPPEPDAEPDFQPLS